MFAFLNHNLCSALLVQNKEFWMGEFKYISAYMNIADFDINN